MTEYLLHIMARQVQCASLGLRTQETDLFQINQSGLNLAPSVGKKGAQPEPPAHREVLSPALWAPRAKAGL